MNQLTFWLGFFAGATSLTIFILVWLWRIRACGTSAKESRNHMEETERLLSERNTIDREIAAHLKIIAEVAEEGMGK